MRGNHESSQAAASEFQTIFPQTQNGVNNNTPAYVYNTANPDAATQPLPTKAGSTFTVGSNISSPSANLNGLSYSFQYGNSTFMLLDQFVPTDGKASNGAAYDVNNNAISSQQNWISNTLSTRPAGTQAFVFGNQSFKLREAFQRTLAETKLARPDRVNVVAPGQIAAHLAILRGLG